MAKTLVTNKQYKACVDAGACTPGNASEVWLTGDDQPVVKVDWNQAKAFSEWVGGRLPTEAEWEYAARSGGKDWEYPWGDEKPTCARAVYRDCGPATAPVCAASGGNTQQGLCDMAGNAWQWVQDYVHPSYNGAPADGSAWENPKDSMRVFRGGSWGTIGVNPSTARNNGFFPDTRNAYLGFRPAR